jgi:ATP-dependent exoDNAse (exonuclease V) beta subunit
MLMDVNERTLPFHPVAYAEWDEASKVAHDKAELALMYVAMTRAVHVLEVTGVGVKSGVLGV